MISLTGLQKSFGKLDVLKSVDCRFERGAVTALVGPNGSGKTTMIKCILGLVKPDSGLVKVEVTTRVIL